MSWRDDPITEKQDDTIALIEASAVLQNIFIPPFNGTTKGEACDYIGNYIQYCFLDLYNPHEDAGDRD